MNDNILILGGGLPIQIGGEVVGGIGVGGAPDAHLDEACAQTGLQPYWRRWEQMSDDASFPNGS